MCAKQVLNVKAGKLHAKNRMEKLGGFRGKFFRDFIVVVVFSFLYVFGS